MIMTTLTRRMSRTVAAADIETSAEDAMKTALPRRIPGGMPLRGAPLRAQRAAVHGSILCDSLVFH